MTLNKLLRNLVREGCVPSIYYRGDLWRAHVNMVGNFRADETTPLKALRDAVKSWRKAGKPMDGMADVVETSKAAVARSEEVTR